MTARPKCPSCGHAAHRDGCRATAPSGCVPLVDEAGTQVGMACYRGGRPPCRCPFGWCHTCRVPVRGASPLPGRDVEIDLDAGPGALPGGAALVVRELADGTLACRVLAEGEEPGNGEEPGRAHAHQLPGAAAWLAAIVTPDGALW